MLLGLLAQAGLAQTVRHEVAGRGRAGCVIAAPHGGYDLHTEKLAPAIAEGLGWGLVVAEGYRSKKAQRWFDVNRPTQRIWTAGEFGPAETTRGGREAYARYREALFAASRKKPLELLVEVHGHARKEQVAGEDVVVQVIELAHVGVPRSELRALAARFQTLVAELPKAQRVTLAIEGLDPKYVYRGRELSFRYLASQAKRAGSLTPQVSRRVLHFELPPRARSKSARDAYAQLLVKLVGPVGMSSTGPK